MLASVNIVIHIVEDDVDTRDLLERVLEKNHIPRGMYTIQSDPEALISQLDNSVNICVIDHTLDSNMTGLELLREVKKKNEDSYVIVITGQENYRIVAKYLREGADDYINKNDEDYLDQFAEAVLKGYQVAKQRIEKAQERARFKKEMINRQHETSELIKQLKH